MGGDRRIVRFLGAGLGKSGFERGENLSILTGRPDTLVPVQTYPQGARDMDMAELWVGRVRPHDKCHSLQFFKIAQIIIS